MSTFDFDTLRDRLYDERAYLKRLSLVVGAVVVGLLMLHGVVNGARVFLHADRDATPLTELSILELTQEVHATSSVATTTVLFAVHNRTSGGHLYDMKGELVRNTTTTTLFEENEYLGANEERKYEHLFVLPIIENSSSTLHITLVNEGQAVYRRLGSP